MQTTLAIFSIFYRIPIPDDDTCIPEKNITDPSKPNRQLPDNKNIPNLVDNSSVMGATIKVKSPRRTIVQVLFINCSNEF